MQTTDKAFADAESKGFKYADAGGSSQQLQYQYLLQQFRAGQLSKVDREKFIERYGLPVDE